MNRSDFESSLQIGSDRFQVFSMHRFEELGIASLPRLPFSIRVILENLLRHLDGGLVTYPDVERLVNWQSRYEQAVEIPYFPSRVVMQDFTGVPAVVDLAAMRDAVENLGQDPRLINPAIPVDLVIDHSIQVDCYASSSALEENISREYQRNRERYALLKWAQRTFDNFNIYPPGAGIVHQVNLEYISRVVATREVEGRLQAFPDTLIGTDSHTPMINGLGILGWGVGGIEAESVLLGQPMPIKIPEVVGIKLLGKLPGAATATDMVLAITEKLRREGVVDKFVEFNGPGSRSLSVPDRATIANMAPEYGATVGFFPVDEKVLSYLQLTGRGDQIELVESYCRHQRLFIDENDQPDYSYSVEFDLSDVVPSLAGPSRPQDRISLAGVASSFHERFADPQEAPLRQAAGEVEDGETMDTDGSREPAISAPPDEVNCQELRGGGRRGEKLVNGSVVIAAITSCTNTSNPSVMIGAAMLARAAVKHGLSVKPFVKTSFAPGSRVVSEYLRRAGLYGYLEQLGFHEVAFGCTTCIGNSGPLNPDIERVIRKKNLITAAVLSGNRNFEARIHQLVKANYLASPLLVIAYALAGRIDFDFTRVPLGRDGKGQAVFLSDLWPEIEDIHAISRSVIDPGLYREQYRTIFDGDDNWRGLAIEAGETFNWDKNSAYIRRPPFFEGFEMDFNKPIPTRNAPALLVLGDTVTTDHISPAGAIPREYPAGLYLENQGVGHEDFNSYGSRRGNHEVMIRGTFANIRIKNGLVAPLEGGFTRMKFDQKIISVFEAAAEYRKRGLPLVVLAGKEYGTGSSRDWAAKGSHLLGVTAILAESYERIHRSNLIGMGVLPLQFQPNESIQDLGLSGAERFSIQLGKRLKPGEKIQVRAEDDRGGIREFRMISRLDTQYEVAVYLNGGILPLVLREKISNPEVSAPIQKQTT